MSADRTSIGPYKILRKLGEGGMGAVYEGVHEAIERRVAIKFLHPEYAHDADVTKRFFNEARAVNRIEHPSLVQISDYGQLPDGTAYIVMEYLRGETLSKRLSRAGGRLPLAETLQIAWQIAAALTVVHDKGIVHRDLKPENIMFVADSLIPSGERVKILDFGIAKLMADVRGTKSKTRSDLIMGTPVYMSPEQCRGAGVVDAKTDVYALGVMLYEMLAGHPPFVGEGSGELIGMHLFREPPPLQELAPNLPPSVTALVHRLLSKERDGRPSMRQVLAALEQQLKLNGAEPLPAAATVPSPPAADRQVVPPPQLPAVHQRPAEPDQSPRWYSRRQLVAIVTIGLVTLTGTGALLINSARRPVPGVTSRSFPPSRPSSPAAKPALEVKAERAAVMIPNVPPPPIKEKEVNNPVVVMAPPTATPVLREDAREHPKVAARPVNKSKLSSQAKNDVVEKAKNNKTATTPAAPAVNAPVAEQLVNKSASPAVEADKNKNPDETQDAKNTVATTAAGQLEVAQRLYGEKNYTDAMQQAMHSENPDSAAALVLIGKSACALHVVDIADGVMNKLGRRKSDRLLIIEKCAEEGFKYSEGKFSAN